MRNKVKYNKSSKITQTDIQGGPLTRYHCSVFNASNGAGGNCIWMQAHYMVTLACWQYVTVSCSVFSLLLPTCYFFSRIQITIPFSFLLCSWVHWNEFFNWTFYNIFLNSASWTIYSWPINMEFLLSG